MADMKNIYDDLIIINLYILSTESGRKIKLRKRTKRKYSNKIHATSFLPVTLGDLFRWVSQLCCRLSNQPARPSTARLNCKNPPKIRFKNSWNWWIILVSATIWQVFDVKYTEWPETEAIWICKNLNEKKFMKSHHVNLFLAGFSSFKLVCGAAA